VTCATNQNNAPSPCLKWPPQQRVQHATSAPFVPPSHSAPPKVWITHSTLQMSRVVSMDPDAFLCRLERSIAAALLTVSGSAQAAFAELRSVRATLHSAIDARCDDLEGRTF